MAPEQIAGDATDERTDQFSFCVALYEALYGERPFRGDSLLQPAPQRDRGRPGTDRPRTVRCRPGSVGPCCAGSRPIPRSAGRRWRRSSRRWRTIRRRAIAAGWSAAAGVALVVGSVVTVTQVVRHRQQAVDREVGRHLHDATLAARCRARQGRGAARAAAPVVRGVRRPRSRARGGAVAAGAGAGSGRRGRVPARRARVRDGAGSRLRSRDGARRELADLLSEHIAAGARAAARRAGAGAGHSARAS